MTPGGDIHRTTQRTRGIQRRIHLHDHAIGNNALFNQLFRFRCSHFGNTLAFTIQNTAYVREQDQIRTQRCRQRRCRLIGINVHQQSVFSNANGANYRQKTAFQQCVNQLRRTRLRQSNVTERFVELGHFYAVAFP